MPSIDEKTVQIAMPGGRAVTAVSISADASPDSWTFVYAPGAGSNIHDPFGAYACRELAKRGVSSLRFQFPYMEARRRSPDRTPVLEATWRAVIDSPHEGGLKLVVGGRSMGGRIASQVVAAGTEVGGLALFAYPLRPPANPSRWRDEHLPAINVPTLFCSGTRDSFATPDELRLAASKVPNAHVHLLDHADHGFGVPKSSGRTKQDVWDEAMGSFVDWLPKR